MTLEDLANLADIVGAILVIASLVYVARQLRQNTEAVLAQSRHAILTASQTEIFAQVEDPEIVTSITKSGTLTPEEHIKLNAFLMAIMRARQFAWFQHRSGAIDDSQWKTEETVLRVIFDAQRTRVWWTRLGRLAFGDEYADFVDSIFRANPPTDTMWQTIQGWSTD